MQQRKWHAISMQVRTVRVIPKLRKWCYTIRRVKKDNEKILHTFLDCMHPLLFGGTHVNEYRIQYKVQDCLGLRV
jgi:hypothetical protein